MNDMRVLIGAKLPFKIYYVNARFNGKTAVLAGPFESASEAGEQIERCQHLAEHADNMAPFASFGVMEVDQSLGYGVFNVVLAANGVSVPVPEK